MLNEFAGLGPEDEEDEDRKGSPDDRGDTDDRGDPDDR